MQEKCVMLANTIQQNWTSVEKYVQKAYSVIDQI